MELEAFEEVMYKRSMACRALNSRSTLCNLELGDGDIICFQRLSPLAETDGTRGALLMPSIIDLFMSIQKHTDVVFKNLKDSKVG